MEEKQIQIEFLNKNSKELLERMGISCDLSVNDAGEEVWVSINTQDSALGFGDVSKNIVAFNTVLRRMVEKNFKEPLKFSLDINDFQKKYAEEIKDTARMHAQRVRYFKKEVEMRPMNAYERRLVHTVLQEYPDIATESRGEGFERRVVVKPVSLG